MVKAAVALVLVETAATVGMVEMVGAKGPTSLCEYPRNSLCTQEVIKAKIRAMVMQIIINISSTTIIELVLKRTEFLAVAARCATIT